MGVSGSRGRPALRAVAIGLLVVSVAGCSRQPQGPGAGAPSPRPEPPPELTPVTQPPPSVVDTGEDFDTIVRSLIAFNDWIVAHPDPSLLVRTMDSSCPCFASTQKHLSDLASKGWRYEDRSLTQVDRVRAERVADDVVDVFVVLRSDEARVLDASGQVVDREPAYPPTSYFYTLRRTDGAGWRITGIEYGSVL